VLCIKSTHIGFKNHVGHFHSLDIALQSWIIVKIRSNLILKAITQKLQQISKKKNRQPIRSFVDRNGTQTTRFQTAQPKPVVQFSAIFVP